MVAVAAPHHDPTGLRSDPQCDAQYFRPDIIAIDEQRDARFVG